MWYKKKDSGGSAIFESALVSITRQHFTEFALELSGEELLLYTTEIISGEVVVNETALRENQFSMVLNADRVDLTLKREIGEATLKFVDTAREQSISFTVLGLEEENPSETYLTHLVKSLNSLYINTIFDIIKRIGYNGYTLQGIVISSGLNTHGETETVLYQSKGGIVLDTQNTKFVQQNGAHKLIDRITLERKKGAKNLYAVNLKLICNHDSTPNYKEVIVYYIYLAEDSTVNKLQRYFESDIVELLKQENIVAFNSSGDFSHAQLVDVLNKYGTVTATKSVSGIIL